MKITVVGCGRLGAPYSVALAERGHDVVALEIDPPALAELQDGRCPFDEPGVTEYIRRNMDAGRLRFTASFDEAVALVRLRPTGSRNPRALTLRRRASLLAGARAQPPSDVPSDRGAFAHRRCALNLGICPRTPHAYPRLNLTLPQRPGPLSRGLPACAARPDPAS